jgi:preprotein translocase SecE subunit
MAKTRAQRKAERRRREAQQQQQGRQRDAESRAQHRTQVPESADVVEAELAERGAELDELAAEVEPDGAAQTVEVPEAPAPSRADVGVPAETEEPADRISRRARRQAEKERKQRARESAQRRQARAPVQERQRGRVIGFFISCWAELKRVQWPNRETLIQASAVTILFIAIAAAYLGALDTVFNFLVQHLL